MCLADERPQRYATTMHSPTLFTLFFLFAISAAQAAQQAPFLGTWGTEKQCNRAPIKPGGTLLAEPFEITAKWLKQRDLWCGLNWGPVDRRSNGFFTAAHARCGEDAVRDYFLRMELIEGEMTLHWDFPISNGPLKRCLKP